MEIKIKTATLKDLSKVQELNLKLFEKERKDHDHSLKLNWTFGKLGTKYFTNRISKYDGCVLIAIVDSQVVGYLCGGIAKAHAYREVPTYAEMENTFVLEKYRSRGIGKRLADEFFKWCKNKGVGKVRVEAYAKNERAVGFYRKNQFKEFTLSLEKDL
jgi:ribosomal protein S18 acetylase RimI-like enzyme